MLAVTSLKRSVAFPDVPTLAESGYPDFDLNDWNGLFATTGIPSALVDRMQAVVAEAIKAFQSGVVPVKPEETIELFAFMEAADESKRRGGAEVSIAEVLKKAGK